MHILKKKFLKVINFFLKQKYEYRITWLIISGNFSIRTYCKKLCLFTGGKTWNDSDFGAKNIAKDICKEYF